MTDQATVVQSVEPKWANDKVPAPWNQVFTNDEWLMHDIVVKTVYGFLVIAIVAHTLTWLWQPWLLAVE